MALRNLSVALPRCGAKLAPHLHAPAFRLEATHVRIFVRPYYGKLVERLSLLEAECGKLWEPNHHAAVP